MKPLSVEMAFLLGKYLERDTCSVHKYVDKMRGGGGQKMSVFVHVHVVVECPLFAKDD